MADALILTKRDDGVAIVSTNDDPLNRMTLEYVDEMLEARRSTPSTRPWAKRLYSGTRKSGTPCNLRNLLALWRSRP